MPGVGFPSFDQLLVFSVVADAGSFSAAARRLGRAQSVVSYAVAQLEQQLGIAVFDRSGRTPVLTEVGRSVLGDARRATAAIDGLRARVAGFQAGLETELRVGVDVMFPTDALTDSLNLFASQFPTVSLCLNIEALGGVVDLVASSVCAFGVGTELAATPQTVRQRPIGHVRLISVAAPTHALALAPSPIAASSVLDATQIVLTDKTDLTRGQDFAIHSRQTWRTGDLGAKHALLKAGLGWGNMPEAMVREDLATGRLVQLHLREGRSHDYPLSILQRHDTLLGPAGSWLADRLAQSIRSSQPSGA